VSVAAAVARVQELQALVGGAPAAPVAPPAAARASSSSPFAAQLAGARAATATPAAAALPATAPTAPVSAGGLAPGTPYAAEIQAAASRHGVDPALLAGLVRQESNFNPRAGSPAGAQGLTQLMPATARGLGVTDPLDPAQSLDGGARYLRQMLDKFGGDPTRALAAYNAGPGAVARFGGVPPYAETQNYVRQVQAYAAEYRASAPAALPAPAAPSTPAAPAALTAPIVT
jgi:soluble lytic murein transglycosylase-like protein